MKTLLSEIDYQPVSPGVGSSNVSNMRKGGLKQAQMNREAAWDLFSRMVTSNNKPSMLGQLAFGQAGANGGLPSFGGVNPQEMSQYGEIGYQHTGMPEFDPGSSPEKAEIVRLARQYAQKHGIDPDVAVRVMASEGLNANPDEAYQSLVVKDGKRERSYGPMQLYLDGGLGNKFMEETGLDPRDNRTIPQQLDYSFGYAAKHGWGSWYGAGRVGIGNWDGIPRQVSDQ